MNYADLLGQTKAAGFEEWSWVIAVVVFVGAPFAWLLKRTFHRRADVEGRSPADNLAKGRAKVGQQIGGAGNIGVQHNHADPALVRELLDRLTAKDQEIGQKNQVIQVKDTEIQTLREQGIRTVVQAATQSGASEISIAALSALKKGDLDQAQALLQVLENAAASLAAPHREEAARLAREQGALWLSRSVEKAYEAFERADSHQHEHLPTLFHLVDISRKRGVSLLALQWAEKAQQVAEKLASSDPKNALWQVDLAVSCVKLAQVSIDPMAAKQWFVAALGILKPLHARAGWPRIKLGGSALWSWRWLRLIQVKM